ncbi:hypothetical protein [Ralstonia phage RP13]|nr:hypothetical protein [Ralstonia phage RP13]
MRIAMIIRSKFKDYYDHQAHIYGGGDPNIVYVRDRIREPNERGYEFPVTLKDVPNGIPFDIDAWRSDNYNIGCEVASLIICGKQYHVYTENSRLNTPWYLINDKAPEALLRYIDRIGRGYFSDVKLVQGTKHDCLVTLSKIVGHPVFIYTYGRWGGLQLHTRCPILKDTGIASIYPAEQIYQDLAYFISNEMKASPDGMPPTQMTDKERIAAHGFDTKRSFRPNMK